DIIHDHREAEAGGAGAAEHDRTGDFHLEAAGGGTDVDRAATVAWAVTGDGRAAAGGRDQAGLDVAALLEPDAAAAERNLAVVVGRAARLRNGNAEDVLVRLHGQIAGAAGRDLDVAFDAGIDGIVDLVVQHRSAERLRAGAREQVDEVWLREALAPLVDALAERAVAERPFADAGHLGELHRGLGGHRHGLAQCRSESRPGSYLIDARTGLDRGLGGVVIDVHADRPADRGRLAARRLAARRHPGGHELGGEAEGAVEQIGE